VAENKYIELVRLLLKAEAVVNAPLAKEDGRTALQAVVYNRNIELA
jgi:ankyrin repeat protein